MKFVLFLTVGVSLLFLFLVEVKGEEGWRIREKRASQNVDNKHKEISIDWSHVGVRHYGVTNPQSVAEAVRYKQRNSYKFRPGTGNNVHFFPQAQQETLNNIIHRLQLDLKHDSQNYEWTRTNSGDYNLKHKNGGLVRVTGPTTTQASIFSPQTDTVDPITQPFTPTFTISTKDVVPRKIKAILHYSG